MKSLGAKKKLKPASVKAKKIKAKKPPGVKAKKEGTVLKRGAAMQVMTYPRPTTKALLVEASRRKNLSLSSFLLLAGMREAAFVLGQKLADLVPPEEIKQYGEVTA